ncbi:MAG: HigA family addiction module antitoxin [Gammaproteobacteria bacterium]
MSRITLNPTTPGEMLLHEFMEPLCLTQYKLAKALDVAPIRISQIIRGQRAITPDTAIRLARYFGNSAEFWLNLQVGYELKIARKNIEKSIFAHVQPYSSEKVA